MYKTLKSTTIEALEKCIIEFGIVDSIIQHRNKGKALRGELRNQLQIIAKKYQSKCFGINKNQIRSTDYWFIGRKINYIHRDIIIELFRKNNLIQEDPETSVLSIVNKGNLSDRLLDKYS